VEQRHRSSARAGHPHAIVRIDRGAEARTLDAASANPSGRRRKGTPVGRELRRRPVPERVRRLHADNEIGSGPQVAFAVEHDLAGRVQASTVPSMNWLWVHTDATVVNSLMTTVASGFATSTV